MAASLLRPALDWLRGARSVAAYFLKGIVRLLEEKEIFLWGQAIAFKVMVTFVPLIILATGIMGRVLRRDRPFETIKNVVREFLPAYQSEDVLSFLELFQQASATITLVGGVGLLITVVTLFTTLRIVIASVFSEDWHDQRTIIGGYLFDARMVVQVGLLFVLSVAATFTVETLNKRGAAFLREMDMAETFLQTLWANGYQVLGILIPYLMTVGVFFQLYYFVAKPRPPKRSAFTGAIVGALLWEVAKRGFTLYATRIASFGRYDGTPEEDGLAVLIDTFGLLIALVFWAYYSGIVLVLGACVALLHETRYRKYLATLGPDGKKHRNVSRLRRFRRGLVRKVRERFGRPPSRTEAAVERAAHVLVPVPARDESAAIRPAQPIPPRIDPANPLAPPEPVSPVYEEPA